MPTLFEDEDVVLYMLRRRRGSGDEAEMVIADTSFVRCRLLGPIHLRLDDDVLVENCTFTPAGAEAVVPLEREAGYIGAFRVSGCAFIDCEFDDVKVVVPPQHSLAAGDAREETAVSA
jgi:hypothetical protein